MALVKLARPQVRYRDLPDGSHEGARYELFDGEVFAMPRPSPLHQLVVLRVAGALEAFRQRYGGLLFCAPTEIVLTEIDVIQPDVAFFKRGREHLIDLEKPIRVPCDLAVEVTAADTAAADRGRKMQWFARHGIREYWIVDPAARRVEVFWLMLDTYALAQTAAGHDSLRSTILPGLILQAQSLFDVGREVRPG